jgi:16S rRNA (guanine966-N2)-methyltransferase
VRIIAGTLKGRQLKAPTWDGLRPTSDRLRETLFDILAPRIAGARVLDGYAGTGAVGIEAISRGASHVTFVERDPRAVRLIRENLARAGVPERYAIIRAGFVDAAHSPASPRADPFDVVFLDPPYGDEEMRAALAEAAPLVGGATLLVLEHARRHPAPDAAAGLVKRRDVASGDSALAFYERSPHG